MIRDISAEESPMRGSILSVCISFCPRLHWRSYWILFYLFGSLWRKEISQLRNPLWGNPHNLYDDYIKRFWGISKYLRWGILDEGISTLSVCELFCPRLHCRSFWIPFFIFLVLFEENREEIPQQIYPSLGIHDEDISTLSVCKLFCPRLHCQSPTLMTS